MCSDMCNISRHWCSIFCALQRCRSFGCSKLCCLGIIFACIPHLAFCLSAPDTNESKPIPDQTSKQELPPLPSKPFVAGFYALANAAMCAQCHGTLGVSVQGTPYSSISGQPVEQFVQKMMDYKAQPANSSVMARIARGLSDDQINSLAQFYSTLNSSK